MKFFEFQVPLSALSGITCRNFDDTMPVKGF